MRFAKIKQKLLIYCGSGEIIAFATLVLSLACLKTRLNHCGYGKVTILFHLNTALISNVLVIRCF